MTTETLSNYCNRSDNGVDVRVIPEEVIKPAPKARSKRTFGAGANTVLDMMRKFPPKPTSCNRTVQHKGASPDFTFPTLLASRAWQRIPKKASPQEKIFESTCFGECRINDESMQKPPAVPKDCTGNFHEEIERLESVAKAAEQKAADVRKVAEQEAADLRNEVARERRALHERLNEKERHAEDLVSALRAEKENEKELRRRLTDQLQQLMDMQGAIEAERDLRRRAEEMCRLAEERASNCSSAASASSSEDGEQEGNEHVLVRRLVNIELEALKGVEDKHERARIRRRLQAKWHPDKNINRETFSTQVLQELQRSPAWQ